jgi:hypothetical protein
MARIHFPYEYRNFDESLVGALAQNQRALDNFLSTQLLDNTTAAATYLAKSGGTMTGTLAMGSNRITASYTPGTGDVATYTWVSDTYMPKSGGTFSGGVTFSASPTVNANLNMGDNIIYNLGDPTNAQHATTKHWIENHAVAYDSGRLNGQTASYYSASDHTHTALGGVVFTGVAYTSNSSNLGASLERWNTCYIVTLNESSDIRLKKHVRDLPWGFGLRAVREVQPIRYQRDGVEHMGFSAQNVEAAFQPLGLDGAVYTGDDGFKGLHPTAVLAVLWQAVRELANWEASR